MEVSFPPKPVLGCLLGSLRCCANASPEFFAKFMHFCFFPMQGCLQGCLSSTSRSSRRLSRQPVKISGTLDAEWIILDRKASDTSKVVLYLPGGGFVARDHTAGVFASRVLPRLASKMPAVPPLLVLNYTLPSSPPKVKEEVEATLSWLRGQGYTEIVVVGDSAGGYLAVQTFLQQTPRMPKICGAVGICPPLDLTFSGDSYERNINSCFLTKSFVEYARASYLQLDPQDAPSISEATVRMHSITLNAQKLALLKEHPMMLVACEQDLMYDDVGTFAAAARAGAPNGVLVCDVRGEASFHISLLMPGLANASHQQAMDQIGSYIFQALTHA